MKSDKTPQAIEAPIEPPKTVTPAEAPAATKDDGPKPDEYGRMTAENWALVKKTEAWRFKAVKAGKRWPEGKELTEKDYDEAIAWLDSKDCVCR